jgi:hypothetical protein
MLCSYCKGKEQPALDLDSAAANLETLRKKVSKTDLLSSVLFATPFRSGFSLNERHTARNLAVPSNRENALESNP